MVTSTLLKTNGLMARVMTNCLSKIIVILQLKQDISNKNFILRKNFLKTYSPSVLFQDCLKLNVFENLK